MYYIALHDDVIYIYRNTDIGTMYGDPLHLGRNKKCQVWYSSTYSIIIFIWYLYIIQDTC